MVWGFFAKIGKGAFNTGYKSVNFAVDIAQEALGADDIEGEGIADTIWGSFNDNILGEGGALQSAIGPEGVGGTLIGALPEFVRQPARNVIGPTLDGVKVAYETVVDDPLGTLMTVASLTSGSEGEGFGGWFDTDVWAKAWEISETRSLGQAVSLAIGTENILDPKEVEKWENTSMHTLVSGTTDALFNIVLDPLYQVGTPAWAGVKHARNGRLMANPEKFVKSAGFLRWNKELDKISQAVRGERVAKAAEATTKLDDTARTAWEIAEATLKDAKDAGATLRKGVDEAGVALTPEEITRLQVIVDDVAARGRQLADDIDEGKRLQNLTERPQEFSEGFHKGLPTDADLTLVDELAGEIFRRFEGKGITPEIAYGLAAAPTVATRQMFIRLAMGDAGAYTQILNAADEWAGLLQEGGTLRKLAETQGQIANLRLGAPVGYGRAAESILVKRLQILEDQAVDLLRNKLTMSDETKGLFDVAFTMRQHRFQHLARFADEAGDVDAVDAIFDAINNKPTLVSGVMDEMLGGIVRETGTQNRMVLGALTEAPRVGVVQELGYGAVSYVKKIPLLGPGGVRVINVFRERTPQQLINWDDVDQSFNQFERMLRDAGRVKRNGKNLFDEVGIDGDELLGQWTRGSTVQRQVLFQNTINDLNKGVLKLFWDDLPDAIKGSKDAKGALEQGLRRMNGALKDAEGTLRGAAESARVFGNRRLQFDMADETFNINRRFIENFTPQQLRQSSLVPRYDLIANVLERPGYMKALSQGQKGIDELMMAWKKSVLLRPAWPIRVLSDELARSAAALGAMHTMRGVMDGMGDLRTAWFKKSGKDAVMPDVIKVMRTKLDDTTSDLGELFIKFEAEFGVDELLDLTRQTISDTYGRQRILRRTGFLTALGAATLGPAGIAGAGLYGLYARRTMSALARREIATTFAWDLRKAAQSRLAKEMDGIKAQVRSGKMTLDEGEKAARTLKGQAELLETQGRTLLAQVEGAVLKVPSRLLGKEGRQSRRALTRAQTAAEKSPGLANFDRVGELMNEARVAGYFMGGYRFGNEFGNDELMVGLHRKALSAQKSTQASYESVATQSKAGRVSYRRYSADDASATDFNNAWNNTVNRQFKPHLDNPNVPASEFQRFSQMFWEGRTDAEIIRWLQSPAASRLRDAMPRHFKHDNMENWVQATRHEIDSILPPIQEFAPLRRKLSEGKDVSWNDEVVPILKKIDKRINGGEGKELQAVTYLRENGYRNFGDIHGSTVIDDMSESATMIATVNRTIDSWMQSLGTMTVDNLSRSTVFSGVYRNEVARLLQAHRLDDGAYRITAGDLRSIENAARRKGLAETRNLLYDLSERTRFGEMVGHIMPFYSAWQEVITRWSGLAAQNPVFVARGIRYFQAIKGEDEDGNSNFVIRMPEGLLSKEVAGLKVFGKLGALGFTSLKLSPDSISMISAGLPGFGPIVTVGASEAVIKNPSLQESLDWMLPYGASEGTSVLDRVAQQVEPTFVRRLTGGYFNTAERQRMLAQVSVDLAVQYEENGIVIEDQEMINDFVAEAERRTSDILKIRAIAGLGIPFAFQVQSPYHKVIEDYREVSSEKGFEEATTWLLANHPDLWAITARRTMVRGVASATLEGDAKYRQHKEFADAHPDIGDFIIGKDGWIVGPEDVQFEFNYAVYKTEIAEGRRERATPEEIMRRPQESRGWYQWQHARDLVYEELERRSEGGGSASLGAKANNDLQMVLDRVKVQLASEYPAWWDTYNESYDQLKQARVMDGFRALIKSDDFEYRPEIPILYEYFEARESIEKELERRGNSIGETDAYSLRYRGNADLKQLWDAIRVTLRNRPDFAATFDRYFENDEIDKKTWVSR